MKARLITMVAVLGAMWLISVGVAAQGLTSAKSTVNASKGGFPAYVVERDAYEGWLTEDDQSNMAAALASLHEPSQKELLDATLAQIAQGREQAYASLKELTTLSPVMSTAAQATVADVTAYNAFKQLAADPAAGRRDRADRRRVRCRADHPRDRDPPARTARRPVHADRRIGPLECPAPRMGAGHLFLSRRVQLEAPT